MCSRSHGGSASGRGALTGPLPPGELSRSEQVVGPRADAGPFPVRMLRLGLRRAGRQARRVFRARLHLRPRPAERRAEAADEAGGPLRVLPVLVARLEVARLRDVERRHPGLDPRGDRAGGRLEAITDKPGHYYEPVFSPDGSRIVYRKSDGGYLVSTAWAADPGLYQVPAAGGKSTLITEDGALPRFGKANDRVFFVKTEGGEDQATPAKRILASIKLDGSEPHEYYISDLATEFAISPDGQWLGFREGFNAYVTPFVETGRRVDIGPKSKAVPLTRVSKEAGEFLHFSGDSSRLYWAYGPELYQRDLKEAFAYLPGAPEKLPPPAAHGLNISFVEPVDMPPSSSTIAFTGGRAVTMNGDEVIEDSVVLVEGNRIKAVGKRGAVADSRGGEDLRRHGQDHPARLRRRPLPRRLCLGRRPAAAELAQRRVARVRRDDRPRSLQRHRRGLHGGRAGARRTPARPAHLLDRHDPLRRRRRLQGRDRLDRRRARAPAPAEDRRRHLRQELPAAAPRAAPADPGGRARGGHHGRPGGRIALRDEHDDGRGRAHHDRAQHPGCQHLRGRRGLLASRQGRLHADAARRVRRHRSARSTGTRRRTSGRTRGSSKFVPPFILDPRSRRR